MSGRAFHKVTKCPSEPLQAQVGHQNLHDSAFITFAEQHIKQDWERMRVGLQACVLLF